MTNRASRKQRPWLETLEDRTVPSTLWDNGPWVTGEGDGAGGANTSAIEAGRNNFGYNVRFDIFAVADDFTVPETSAGWTVSSFVFHSYQTNSSTESPYIAAFAKLWSGVPGEEGSVVLADTTIDNNILSYTFWTGTYRVTETTLTNTARPVMVIGTDTSLWPDFPAVLAPGTYWIEWALFTTGATGVGVWVNPTVPANPAADNARHFSHTTGMWTPVIDAGGSELGQDFPFLVEGEEVKPFSGGGIGDFAYAGLAGDAALVRTLTPTTLQAQQAVTDLAFVAPADVQTATLPTVSGVTEAVAEEGFELDLSL